MVIVTSRRSPPPQPDDPWRRRAGQRAAGALGAARTGGRGGAEISEPRSSSPALPRVSASAARIHIVSRKFGVVDIVFKPDQGLGAAAQERLSRLVRGSEQDARRPCRAGDHRAQDRAIPTGSTMSGSMRRRRATALSITVSDDHGHVLADMIAGKSEDIGDPTGATGLFVRRPERRPELARARRVRAARRSRRLDRQERHRHRSLAHPVDGRGACRTASPTKCAATSRAMSISRLPRCRRGANSPIPTAPDNVAAALAGFTFDDVVPVKEIDFSNATRLVTKTFDGLSVTVDVGPSRAGLLGRSSARRA